MVEGIVGHKHVAVGEAALQLQPPPPKAYPISTRREKIITIFSKSKYLRIP
jgi:hypothetical protein